MSPSWRGPPGGFGDRESSSRALYAEAEGIGSRYAVLDVALEQFAAIAADLSSES
jgi:hypothetical protein